MLTQARLQELFTYDSETGAMHWKKAPKRASVDGQAGSIEAHLGGLKYRRFKIDGNRYRAHNIVWLYCTGRLPDKPNVIDHIDGDGLNNRIGNLRMVTPIENNRNRKSHRNGALYGSQITHSGKYEARRQFGGKYQYLGTFLSEWEAHQMSRIWSDLILEGKINC